jgi:hypothetical protein
MERSEDQFDSLNKMGSALGFTRKKFVSDETVKMSHGTSGVNPAGNPKEGKFNTHTRVIKTEHVDGHPANAKNPEGFALGAGHVKVRESRKK